MSDDLKDICMARDNEITPIGVGKVVLSSEDTEFYNIPHLHFLLAQDGDGDVEAISLEFGIVSSGKDSDSAVKGLTEELIEFIHKNMSVYGFEALKEIAASDAMDEDWRRYRAMEFDLALQKRDLGRAFVDKIVDKIVDKARDEFMEKYGIKASLKYNTLAEAA